MIGGAGGGGAVGGSGAATGNVGPGAAGVVGALPLIGRGGQAGGDNGEGSRCRGHDRLAAGLGGDGRGHVHRQGHGGAGGSRANAVAQNRMELGTVVGGTGGRRGVGSRGGARDIGPGGAAVIRTLPLDGGRWQAGPNYGEGCVGRCGDSLAYGLGGDAGGHVYGQGGGAAGGSGADAVAEDHAELGAMIGGAGGGGAVGGSGAATGNVGPGAAGVVGALPLIGRGGQAGGHDGEGAGGRSHHRLAGGLSGDAGCRIHRQGGHGAGSGGPDPVAGDKPELGPVVTGAGGGKAVGRSGGASDVGPGRPPVIGALPLVGRGGQARGGAGESGGGGGGEGEAGGLGGDGRGHVHGQGHGLADQGGADTVAHQDMELGPIVGGTGGGSAEAGGGGAADVSPDGAPVVGPLPLIGWGRVARRHHSKGREGRGHSHLSGGLGGDAEVLHPEGGGVAGGGP